MKKIAALLIGISWFSFTIAADISTFVVQLSPTTTNVNEAVDLTVKAIDSNGSVVKNYAGDIFIDLSSLETSIDSQDYTLPADGIYTFLASDQGVKTFFKGLVVKKAGTYNVKVSEIINDEIKGTATLVVKGDGDSSALGSLTISSPTMGSTETNKTINVVGNSSLKNSPIHIYINGIKVKEDLTSANGDFNIYVSDITAGQNTLQAKIVDIDGNEAAISSEVDFQYQPNGEAGMDSFEVLPGNTVKQGQKVTFVFRATGAKSVELTLVSDNDKQQKVILDKIDENTWKKEFLMDTAGAFTVNAIMSTPSENKSYANIGSVSVLDTKSVQEVKYFADNVDKSQLHLSWTYLGTYAENETPYFSIQYALDKADINAASGVIATGASHVLSGIDLTQSYYLRITPVDETGKQIGDPSDIILIEPAKGSAPLCRVEGVRVLTKKIADKYYLTWDKIVGADRYIVYRSDSPIAPGNGVAGMQKVGEASDNKFEYPYDPNAQKDTFAYYAVVAICSDGSALQIEGTQKVKVGPVQNIMFMLLISGLLFGLYKLNIIGKRN